MPAGAKRSLASMSSRVFQTKKLRFLEKTFNTTTQGEHFGSFKKILTFSVRE
jgi:hypothetical protein